MTATAKSTPAAEEAEGTKITLKSDGNGFKVNYGGGGFKLSDLSKPAPGDSAKVPQLFIISLLYKDSI